MNPTTRLVTLFSLAVAAMGGVGIGGYVAIVRASAAPSAPTIRTVSDGSAALVERGRYLMSAMGCADCHTPHHNGEPIGGMFLAGHPQDEPLPQWDPSLLERNIGVAMAPTFTAFAGPFGVSVAANLTPDPETGIGRLTADELIRSWRTGKHWREDRPIMPPMPYPFYSTLTDDDIRALHACLMSLPPVRNRPPDPKPAPRG
jgi:mono/diheme cytochrome c family protein